MRAGDVPMAELPGAGLLILSALLLPCAADVPARLILTRWQVLAVAHSARLRFLLQSLLHAELALLDGHRIMHGASRLTRRCMLTLW